MELRISLALAALQLLLLANCAAAELSRNVTEARLWYEDFERELGTETTLRVEANWNYQTNITRESAARRSEAQVRLADFRKRRSEEIRQRFDYRAFGDANLTRLFEKTVDIGTDVANETMQIRLGSLSNQLIDVYNTATVADPNSGEELLLDRITQVLAKPDEPETRLRHFWVGWRDASGRRMKQNYVDYASTLNTMIREAGYENMAKYWQSLYEPKAGQNFEQMMEQMWNQTLPLYQQLHAYVRKKLREKYGTGIFPPTRQIPAHILGNMWSQSWANTYRFTIPFPNVAPVDVTEEMRRQNWNASHMFRVSERFFTSIGLKEMTDTFWQKSVIERLPNVDMVCHASAWDFYTGRGDFRIKQCTTITTSFLATTHHEMGHIQYFQQYEHQPVLYRRGANPGFHEAVGDVMELSVMTPDHLVKIGLLENTVDSREYYLNYLFQMALKKVAFLPFGYLIDRWRWRVFDGAVSQDQYNDFWWRLRCQLQGVASPVKRSSDDFDPGAKYHVPANTPYIRYFVSHVLQFQLYEALCNASGHTGPLYRCDFYQNRQAGILMEKMLAHGSSLHWEDVLLEMTGSKEMSSEPMMRYFHDLMEYLKEQNANEEVGWDAECPTDDWYDAASTAAPETTTRSAVGIVAASFGVASAAAVGLLLPLMSKKIFFR